MCDICKMKNNLPRGIRNNNPLNIIKGSNWIGLSKKQTDSRFCQFSEMKYGIRAAMMLLRKYIKTYKRNTVQSIIEKWAPASDGNYVKNYVDAVCKYIRKEPNTILTVLDIPKLTCAMACVECGQKYVQLAEINVKYCETIYNEYL